jgi:DNA-directed RNA polymerase subunit RPC12/RpoP
MKVICLSCGHKVELGDAYDDYAGQVRCVACGALLEIKTEAGGLRSVTVAHEATVVTPAAEALR